MYPNLLIVMFLFVMTSATFGNTDIDKGIELFERGDYKGAGALFEQLTKNDGLDPDAYYYLGRTRLINNDYEQAAECFEKALELNADMPDYYLWLVRALKRGIPYSGTFGKIKRSNQMMKALNKAIKLDPANIPIRSERFYIYLGTYKKMGDKGPVTGDVLTAEIDTLKALDSLEGHLAAATYYHTFQDNEKAESEFKIAAGLEPDDRGLVQSYAGYLCDLHRYDESLRLLDKYISANPGDLTISFDKGVTLVLSGLDYDEAKSCLLHCLELQSDDGIPTKSSVYWCLGVVCSLMNQPQEAQEMFDIAGELDPKHDELIENNSRLSRIKELMVGK